MRSSRPPASLPGVVLSTIVVVVVATAGSLAGQGPPVPTWEVREPPLASVGGGPDDGVLFTRIGGVAPLDDGRIAVADAGERRVVLLSPDGRVEATVGGAGRGPGEFDDLTAVWASPGGSFSTWDAGLRRVTHFAADGRVRSTHRVLDSGESPVPDGSLDAHYGTLPDGRIVLAWIVASPEPGRPSADRMVFGLFGPEGDFQRLLGEHPGLVRLYGESWSGPLPFSPYLWTAVVGDTLAATDGVDGRVRFYTPDTDVPGPIREWTAPMDPVERDAAWAALDRAAAEGRLDDMAAGMLDRADRSVGAIPVIGRMLGDDRGRLWLKRYEPGRDALLLPGGRYRTGGEWIATDGGGTPVARLRMPDSWAPLAIRGDRLVAVARDAFDVERIVLARFGPGE